MSVFWALLAWAWSSYPPDQLRAFFTGDHLSNELYRRMHLNFLIHSWWAQQHELQTLMDDQWSGRVKAPSFCSEANKRICMIAHWCIWVDMDGFRIIIAQVPMHIRTYNHAYSRMMQHHGAYWRTWADAYWSIMLHIGAYWLTYIGALCSIMHKYGASCSIVLHYAA